MKIQKVNKEKFKNWTIFLFFLVGSVLNSCSNFLSFDENRTDKNKTSAQDDKCIITVSSDFYSNDGSRAAFPDFLLSPDTLYFAEISYTSGSSKKWLGEDSVSDTAVVLKNNYSDVIRFVFCAPQETSSYTLALYACPKQTGSQVSAVKKSAFAQGDASFELSAGQKVLSSTLNIKLRLQESSGKGKVDLPLSFDPALRIVAAKVNVTKDGVSDSSGNNYEFKMEVSGSGARLSAENVSAGTYLAIMKFYNSMTDFSSSAEVAVNSAVQHISVYSEMTTNLWFIGGKKHGTAEADGTFKPSALELTKYDFTELYVCGKDGGGESGGKRSFYVSSNFGSSVPDGNDTYDGSMAKPFATVQKAVDTIAASGDTSKKYTIYVDGTVEAPYDDFTNGTFISIGTTASNLDLTIKGLSADARAVLNARQKSSYKGCVLTSEDTSLTLENLKITGGKEINSGGIYIKSGNLTLKNCVVTKNESSNGGGGIQFDGEKLVVENSEISGNNGDPGGLWVKEDSAQTKIKNSNIKNNVASSGGGGLKLAGESTIEGCDISGNKAESGVGGGLILSIDNKSCKIINSVISNNTAGENGGGIYMTSGTLILGSGAVIGKKLDPDVAENNISKVATSTDFGNKSTDTSYSRVGAGLYVRYGTVNMSEGAYICKNYTSSYGGGVYVSPEGKFNMSGGVIGWNFSRMGGGIIADGADDDSSNYSVLNISGKAKICYNKAGFTSVQGCTGRGAGIFACGDLNISGNAEIFGNYAEKSGAGIHSEKKLVMTGGSAHDNEAGTDGAGIYIYSGEAELSSCTIKANKAGGNGGAIFIKTINQAAEAKLTIKENVSIDLNSADTNKDGVGDGGAIYATTDTINASGKCSYVYIGEDGNTENIVITGNNANRGGAFYGADNARFVMNAGKVFENYSTGNTDGDGGGAMFIWGSHSNYSTFTMNGGVISGNMAKNGGAGGAVHIDHGSGGMAAFIMTGGLLSGNKATDENGNGSKLGGAIYVKKGGQIKLGGSAVVAVSEGNDNCNDIWLATGKTITVTGTLTPENNAAAGNPKYTARITPQTYNAGTPLITAEGGVTLEDEVGKFCVTGNAVSDEWFITTEGKLSKPAAISSLQSSPDFSIYPKLTVSSGEEMNKLSGFVNNGNTMAGTTVTLLNDITLGSDFQKIGNTDKPFSGTFDGNGKTINSGTASLWTIFYQVTGGTIKNLTSSGKFSMSGIVANLSNNGLIENCTNTATVTSDTYSPLGGVCAKMEDSIIDRCVNKGSVKLENSGEALSLGGICGSATGVIKNSTNYASVDYKEVKSNDYCFVGGILGTTIYNASVETKFYNCINIGDVSGNEESASGIGGILGRASVLNTSVYMYNCVNMGSSSKNAIAGKYAGGVSLTGKDQVHTFFTYYLKDSAPLPFAWTHDNAKAYSFKKRAALYMTTERVTVGTFPSDDLIYLLNEWVEVNSNDTEKYLKWSSDVDGNPALSY